MKIKLSPVVFAFVCLLFQTTHGQVRYQEISSAEDVIEQWSEDSHLYVKGDLGVGIAQLAALESWLDENGLTGRWS